MRVLLLSSLLFVTGCAGGGLVKMEQDTYMLYKSGTLLSKSPGPLLVQAIEEANAFCEAEGKRMETVSTASSPRTYGSNPEAQIQFKCVNK